MARITRKSYKRKKIVLGLCMFASVALISTGFAAWILSADANSENQGNIIVGTVNDGTVEFGAVNYSASDFRFDADINDTEGRLKFDSKYSDDYERLTVTVSGYVINADYLDKITVFMDVSDEVKSAANDDEYIKLPDCALGTVTLPSSALTMYTITAEDVENGTYSGLVEGDKICNFNYDISFEWGAKFNNENPGYYYDDPTTGGEFTTTETGQKNYTISNETVKTTMEDVKTKLETNAEYKITLTAIAKS